MFSDEDEAGDMSPLDTAMRAAAMFSGLDWNTSARKSCKAPYGVHGLSVAEGPRTSAESRLLHK